jgi:hypothetical protein
MKVECNNLVKTKISKFPSVNEFKIQDPLMACILSKINLALFSHHLNLGIGITEAHHTLIIWS